MLHATFLFTRCYHHDGVSKQASVSLAPLLWTIHKEDMIERQRKTVKVDWRHTYVVKCSRLRWYKGVFPGAFFSLNKALFLFLRFCLFCFFWGGGGEDIFYLTITECGWNISNAGEIKLKFSCGWESRNAIDTRSMRVSSHIW